MTTVVDPTEKAQIIDAVQKALDKRQPKGYRVEVSAEGVLREDDWYHVVVQADQDRRNYDFYDVLAEAEAELQDERHLNVLLVPAVGD
jgi:hypothetical protein